MFSVEFWGSHPDKGNDDCLTGLDFPTMADAQECFDNPWKDADFARYFKTSTAYIRLEGEGQEKIRKNDAYKPSKGDNEWAREIAHQDGMMGGCDAYNDAMESFRWN